MCIREDGLINKLKKKKNNTPSAIILTAAPLGLGRYISLGEYCDPQTDSSVFLISSLNCLNKRGYPYVWMDVQYVEI